MQSGIPGSAPLRPEVASAAAPTPAGLLEIGAALRVPAMSVGQSADDPTIAVVPRAIVIPTGRFDPACVIAFCATFALLLFLPQLLNDGDTLWQIRTGEW